MRDSGYALVTERVTGNRRYFYIFRDTDSGFNHGYLSGVFASNTEALKKIHVNPKCVDNEMGPTPCRTDSKQLDRQRGTVLEISIDPLGAGEFVGLNIEDPGAHKSNTESLGYDLRGSAQVLFDARSPVGSKVQFGAGGGVSDFVSLSKQWSPMSIRIDSLRPPPDLSKVHTLFSVSTNEVNASKGGTVLLDNIRLDPPPSSRISVLGFPVSSESFGESIKQPVSIREEVPANQILNNLATTYESALATLAFLHRGTNEDQTNARLLLDTFHYALFHDNSGDPLPSSDGAKGLRNGYSSGDIALLNGQGRGGAQSGDVRLAGFSSEFCEPSGYCLMMDGATGGNIAFAMLALMAGYAEFGDGKYLEDARILGAWIVEYLIDPDKKGYGGYFLGYADSSSEKFENRWLKGKSVENNADIFAAFNQLAAIERRLGNAASAEIWTRRAHVAGDFVLSLFDPESESFFAGTVPSNAQSGTGVEPAYDRKKGNDVINKYRFLDANIFPVLALAEMPRYHKSIDWRQPVRFVVKRFKRQIKLDDNSFTGFGIDEKTRFGADGIAWEFTAQAISAMRLVDRLYGSSQFEDEARLHLASIERAQLIAPYSDKQGLVASTLAANDRSDPSNQCLMTPFQCIPQRVGLAATIWAIFAELNVNPLSPKEFATAFNKASEK